MAEVIAISLMIILGAGFLVLCSLPLALTIKLWYGSYQISKARKQAEAILAQPESLPGTGFNETHERLEMAQRHEEIMEAMRGLSGSRNSYNKILIAKLQERL